MCVRGRVLDVGVFDLKGPSHAKILHRDFGIHFCGSSNGSIRSFLDGVRRAPKVSGEKEEPLALILNIRIAFDTGYFCRTVDEAVVNAQHFWATWGAGGTGSVQI